MPEINSVYLREMQSRMYSPSAYFLAKWSVSTAIFAFQPVIYSLVAFYFVEFTDSTHENFREWVAISVIQAVTGSSLGYLFAAIFHVDINAVVFINMYLFVIYFSSEAFASFTGGENPFVDMLAPSSPFTYTCELMMRRLLSGVNQADKVLDFFHMTRGSDACMIGIVSILLTYFSLSWLVTVIKTRILYS